MSTRVHALEGSMVSTSKGIEKLIRVVGSGGGETCVFVLPPTLNPELTFTRLLEKAAERSDDLWELFEMKKKGWLELASSSLSPSGASSVMKRIESSFTEVGDILRAVSILRSADGGSGDYLENLSSSFLALILLCRLDEEGIKAALFSEKEILDNPSVIRGYRAVIVAGKLTYCDDDRDASGREHEEEGWGEYSAALIARALSSELTYWNQKSLLYSASRKDVPNAHIIRNLSYAEATELSFFGAPVVHPHSFIPAQEAGLTLTLRWWGDIEEKGTTVTREAVEDRRGVKAFSVVKNISLINVEGSGMSGVPGVSSRLFTALKDEGISVIFISQASSEYSICFAVPHTQCRKAVETITNEFEKEIGSHQITSVDSESGLSILAVVGEGMPGHVGVAGKFFSSLARAGVNIRAIAQGSSERNISAVIASDDAVKAERALHTVFFMSEQTLSLGLFGPGNIGGTLLDQIGRERERLKREFDLDIRVRGIATSTRMMLSEEGIDLSTWREKFPEYSIPYNEEVFLSHIKAQYYPHWVLVDATSSEERAMQYRSFIEEGFHVITPNKKAPSGPYENYEAIFASSMRTGRKFLYETTVGAGLPIIVTLKDLRETGDRIEKVEGMVSGTLSWLFSTYDASVPFSSLVLRAKELGFTEPDPRDDLSGMDVARKTVILARELGYRSEVSSFPVESLVPKELKSVSREEFLSRISEMDERIYDLYKEAEKEGMRLRYVGTVDEGKCSVGLRKFPLSHPFSQSKGTDNVIQFTTARYHDQPLVVQGPGAGPEVTAAGIFADILRLSAYLGSKI